MRREMISEAVGNIDARYVQEAGGYTVAKGAGRAGRAWRRTAIAAAVLLCAITARFCIPSVAVPLEGFFHDITRRLDGAVIGTEYENATQEIKIEASAAVMENGKLVLPLEITFLVMGEKEPYIYLTGGAAALGDYRILDASGNEICSASGQQEATGALEDGKAALVQPLATETLLERTEYTLVVESVYGLQKAEQPLEMKGHWECGFTLGE